jgi:hypothetical protein
MIHVYISFIDDMYNIQGESSLHTLNINIVFYTYRQAETFI